MLACEALLVYSSTMKHIYTQIYAVTKTAIEKVPKVSGNSIYFILETSYHLPAHTEEPLIYELLDVVHSEFTMERMEN